MKKIFLILSFCSFVFAHEILEVKISKIHGVVTFVNSLNGQGHIVRSYKRIYEQTHKNDNLKEVKHILKKIYSAKIYNYKDETYLYNVIKQQSSFYDNVSELEKNILQYKTSIKYSDVKNYFSLLKKYLPMYEQLIYNDSLLKLQSKKKEIKNLIIRKHFDSLIYKAANFYGINDKDVKTIYLSLYPITHGRSTMAFMLGNVESIGVLVNRKKLNLDWLLSATIFHEITHTFYKQNYDEIKHLLYRNHFVKYKDQTVFNESMATAFGAGWAFNQLTGLNSNGKWYNNDLYDSMAKNLYPLVSQYVAKSKKIDNKFVKKCYNIYKNLK